MNAPLQPLPPPPTLDLPGYPRLRNVRVMDPGEAERRLRAHPAGRAYLRDWNGSSSLEEPYDWGGRWHHIPAEILLQVFTLNECVGFWIRAGLMSDLGDYMEREYPILYKIESSLWRYGGAQSYSKVARALRGLRRLDPALPDFEFKLTWTTAFQAYSWSLHSWGYRGAEPHLRAPLYLDAPLGLLVYYKGEHVLTVGFAFHSHGVLVSQVQLRNKKGNRFLYKLPTHYLDWVLDVFARAFRDQNLYLVTGESAANAVEACYANPSVPHLAPEVRERILNLYDRALDHYERMVQCNRNPRCFNRQYIRLRRTETPTNESSILGGRDLQSC